MRYVPALDGLRAVAILGVLVFHILPGALPGGFTGVDVFFVLSGYLIASVILHDLRARRFSMREFYLRRIQRLLPNAVVMVGSTVGLATLFFLPSFVAQVAEHGLWTLANLSNFFIVHHFGGYWQDVATATPLLHTWSLAVEEQFYLALPVTLWLLARPALLRRPRAQSHAALAVLCGLATASYLLALSGTWANPVPTFYLLPARAWEPLLGAALAVWRVPAAAGLPLRDTAPASSRQLEIVGWAGLAMIVAAYFVTREGEEFPGWIALLPTVGTLAVLFAIGERPTAAGQLLARPAMVGIGKLSYSLYLWHWPLLVFARTWCEWNGHSPQLGTWIGAALGILLAVLAYWAIERPLRRRGPGRRRRLLVLAAGFLLCAAATLAVARRAPSGGLQALQAYFDPPENAAQLYNSARLGLVEVVDRRGEVRRRRDALRRREQLPLLAERRHPPRLGSRVAPGGRSGELARARLRQPDRRHLPAARAAGGLPLPPGEPRLLRRGSRLRRVRRGAPPVARGLASGSGHRHRPLGSGPRSGHSGHSGHAARARVFRQLRRLRTLSNLRPLRPLRPPQTLRPPTPRADPGARAAYPAHPALQPGAGPRPRQPGEPARVRHLETRPRRFSGQDPDPLDPCDRSGSSGSSTSSSDRTR